MALSLIRASLGGVLVTLICCSQIVAGHQISRVPVPGSPPELSTATRPSPWDSPSPELTRAVQSAKRSEDLLKVRDVDGAIVEFKIAALQRSRISDAHVAFIHSVHARMIASELIWQHRAGDAGALLDSLAKLVPADASDFRDAILQTSDVRLYIAAESNDAPKALELLKERRAASRRPACPDQPYFPQVIAPLHHDARIAAILSEMGCQDAILAQLDDLAGKPIGASEVDRGLPPHS